MIPIRAAIAGRRRAHRTPRAQAPMGRARIGSPARKRRRSPDRSPAVGMLQGLGDLGRKRRGLAGGEVARSVDIPDSASLDNQRFTLTAWARPDGPGANNDAYGSV